MNKDHRSAPAIGLVVESHPVDVCYRRARLMLVLIGGYSRQKEAPVTLLLLRPLQEARYFVLPPVGYGSLENQRNIVEPAILHY